MTHSTDLQLSMHADDALPTDEAVVVSQHLETCVECQAKLVAAKDETRFIAVAMESGPLEELEVAIPKFSRPASLRNFALANVVSGLVIWLAQFLWKTLFGELAIDAAAWITSVYLPDIYEMTSATALYYLQEGTAMFDAYLGLIVLSLSTITAVSLLLMYYKSRAATSLCLLVFMGATVVAPAPANALQIKIEKEGVITIAETETIDDTLVVAAERIVIKGKVTGDLLAVGRSIDIDGSIEGNLFAFAESVTVTGTVGGLVLGAGSTFQLNGASVGGDLWAAGAKVTVDAQTRVANNAGIAAQTATVEGSVAKDLYAFAEIVELDGEVGQDLEAFGDRVRLLDEAHVGGNARLRIPNEDSLYRAAGARIDGEIEFLDMPAGPTNRYASGEFYLWQAARLVSAVLVGLALFWLIPGFRTVSVSGGIDGLKTAGIGLVALVGAPIVAVVVAITLVGLPFSFIAIIAWLVAIYLAKIVVGAFIGRTLLSSTKYGDRIALVLLAGITAIIVAVNLPAIGGFINFVLTIIGIGLIVQRLLAALAARDSATTGMV